MTSLARFDTESLELFINENGECFASIRGIARMVEVTPKTIRRFLSEAQIERKTAKIPTNKGIQSGDLLDEDAIMEVIIKYKPGLFKQFAKLGLRFYLHSVVRFTYKETPIKVNIYARRVQIASKWEIPKGHWYTEANKNTLDTRKAIHEIKKISGLTWDKLAQLFDVSRRTLHFWASGKQLSSSNEEDLYRLVEVFRYINRGNADINRQVLISAQENGQIPFALLGEKKYEETKKLLGQGLGKPKPQLQPLSKEASLLRTPPPPDELVGATNEPVHQEVGKTRKAKSVRQKTSGAKKY